MFVPLRRHEAVDPVAATLVVHALPAQAVRIATRAVCGLRRTRTLPRRGWDGELAGELRTRLKLLPCLLFSPSPIDFRTALSVRIRALSRLFVEGTILVRRNQTTMFAWAQALLHLLSSTVSFVRSFVALDREQAVAATLSP